MTRVEQFSGEPSEWDAFARAQAGFTHYHLFGWKRVMEEALGHETMYYVARDPVGQIEGVLPLVRVRSHLFGHFLVSMPFVNYGGPLGTDAGIQALAAAAVDRADREGVKLLELRSRRELPLGLPASHRKITVVLDLAGDTKQLWDGFDANVRRRVRRSQKEGVTVRFGLDQVAPFYEVFAVHMRDLGTPVHGRRLFDLAAEVFPESAWFGCAWLRGEPIAAIGGFDWNDEFEVTWASALVAHKQVAANMHIYWAFMEHAMERNLRVFNFGRCTPGGGTHRFKMQWGGREEQLWWYQHARGSAVSTPSPDEGAFSWGPKAWRHLPLSVASVVGPRIVRFIP
jgi:serine/alanine adding enzyme